MVTIESREAPVPEAEVFCFEDHSFSCEQPFASRVQRLMLGEGHVQYELDDGRTVRISSLDPESPQQRLFVNVLSADPNRDFGAVECTDRGAFAAFVCSIDDGGSASAHSDDREVQQALSDCEQLLEKLSRQPAIVHFSTHGDVRPFESFEVRQDSGGQVTYVDGAVKAAAKRGYSAMVVNQGWGPSASKEQPLHEGAIISASGIYYYPKVDAELNDLRPKEHFTTAYCHKIADKTSQFLEKIGIENVALVGGHYVDGAVAIQKLAENLRGFGKSPKITYTDHSNGFQRVVDRGFYPGALWRVAEEMRVLANPEVSYYPASQQLAESALRFYSRTNHADVQDGDHTEALQEIKDYLDSLDPTIETNDQFCRDARALVQAIETSDTREVIAEAFMKIAEQGEGSYSLHITKLKDPLWSLVPLMAPEEITPGLCVPSALDQDAFRPRREDDLIPQSLKEQFPWLREVENGDSNLICFFGRTDPAKNVQRVLEVPQTLHQLVSQYHLDLNAKFLVNVTYPNDDNSRAYADRCTELADSANKLCPDMVGIHPGLKQGDVAKVLRHAAVLLQLQINEPFGMVAQQGGGSAVPIVATRVAEAARLALGAEYSGGLGSVPASDALKDSQLFERMLSLERKGTLTLHQGGFFVGTEYPGEAASEEARQQWNQDVVESAALAVAFLTQPEMQKFRQEMGANALNNTHKASLSWDQQFGNILQELGLPDSVVPSENVS